MSTKRWVVIGASGFIGSQVYNRLKEDGENVIMFCHDIRHTDMLNHHLANTDVVINCAALANLTACIEDPQRAYAVNTMGVVNILEACRKNNVKRVVLSSSNVVYGSTSPYKSSILAAEDIGRTYSEMYGMSIVSLRYANVYGKGSRNKWKHPTIFAAFKKQKEEKGYVEVMGDGSQTRNYIHVSDVVDAIISAGFSTHSGILDICTNVDTSVSEIANLFKCPISYVPSKQGDVAKIKQDPSMAKEILKWEARVKLEEGIKDVL